MLGLSWAVQLAGGGHNDRRGHLTVSAADLQSFADVTPLLGDAAALRSYLVPRLLLAHEQLEMRTVMYDMSRVICSALVSCARCTARAPCLPCALAVPRLTLLHLLSWYACTALVRAMSSTAHLPLPSHPHPPRRCCGCSAAAPSRRATPWASGTTPQALSILTLGWR